jgi:hypothetical protein
VSWAAVIPAALPNTDRDYVAIRDALTLNAGAEKIFTDNKDKGYALSLNTQLVILTPFQLIGRLNRAMGLLQQGFSGSAPFVGYSFRVIPTLGFSVTTYPYLCLPKNKIVGGNRKNMAIYDKFDESTYSDVAYGWARFGAAIADQEQIVRLHLS